MLGETEGLTLGLLLALGLKLAEGDKERETLGDALRLTDGETLGLTLADLLILAD